MSVQLKNALMGCNDIYLLDFVICKHRILFSHTENRSKHVAESWSIKTETSRPRKPPRHTVKMYASAAKPAFTSLLTCKLFGFNFAIHFTPIIPIRCKLFPAIRFDFLLHYHTITHWSLTLKFFSAMPTHVMNTVFNFIQISPVSTEISRHAQ